MKCVKVDINAYNDRNELNNTVELYLT